MKNRVQKIDNFHWKIPKNSRDGMHVDALIIANSHIFNHLEEQAIRQLTNVACLPGIVEPVVAMPDMHWGYGLPMGAVGAFDSEKGVISAGCTGFDINCGIHMLSSSLPVEEIRSKLKILTDKLFKNVPCGVGSKSSIKLSKSELESVLIDGANWAVENGYGVKKDLKRMEEEGRMEGADSSKVSLKAKKRGAPQVGTLGAGNHFLEVQAIEKIYDNRAAKVYGSLSEGKSSIMIHCGSRGLGHQVATDYLRLMGKAVKKYGISIPDKQLVCAPAESDEGQDYFSAMKCAVNYAFANRQVIAHLVRESFSEVFGLGWEDLGLETIYDVCHNICKLEDHIVDGEKRKLYIHRKGATRAFGPNHPLVPAEYRKIGQPVLIAGSMGTASYILSGTEQAMKESFGSCCHGAGRCMSRTQAIKSRDGKEVKAELQKRGEEIRATNIKLLAEEAPTAYKDVDQVIASVADAGIANKVARLIPLGVVKG